MIKFSKKENAFSITGIFSGMTSFLGSYQVCHNVCIGIIALLGIIGITVVGMPLLFLTKVAIPFWIASLVLFAISLSFYFTKKCISKKLLIFNSGLVVAGIPFNSLQRFSIFFWSIGGGLVVLSLILLTKDTISKKLKVKTS